MSDIVTSRIFSDGEKGITAAKMNDIIGGASIQTAFYSAKSTASTADAADTLLLLKAAGSYAQAPVSTFATSLLPLLPDPNPNIWSQRLKSFNAIGNPNFEVDQRNCGSLISAPNGMVIDRWGSTNAGTLAVSGRQIGENVLLPGTNFMISRSLWRYTLTTQQASLGAGDFLRFFQYVEGPQFRELAGDVTSISLLVRSSVAGLKFSAMIQDSPATRTLVKLATIPTANTWTLIQFPNLPVISGGNFAVPPGLVGYFLQITPAAGSTFIAPAADTWQTGNFMGAPGMSNFAANPVNSTFDIAFIQHEPGPLCSTFQDLSFSSNLDSCLRYFSKSYSYAVKPGTADNNGSIIVPPNPVVSFGGAYLGIRFPKIMATTPAVSCWSPATGGGGYIRDIGNSTDRAITGVLYNNDSGFGGWTFSGVASTPNPYYNYHYTADTGW